MVSEHTSKRLEEIEARLARHASGTTRHDDRCMDWLRYLLDDNKALRERVRELERQLVSSDAEASSRHMQREINEWAAARDRALAYLEGEKND